ncbi:MAG: immunoglobulin domain-containing protein, partial [Pirellulales bacterium]|nr:immunoglobulin domain-containing protein [Pirellulales bacterium]
MRRAINYFNDTKRALSLILSLLILSLYAIDGNSQTPGLIYQPANVTGAAVMDPNGDGWVSQTTAGFQQNDLEESELPYARIALPFTEPNSDPYTAPDCGFTDIVTQGGAPILMYNDGTNLLFRYRIGKTATNSKGYSILIDTDSKFGYTGDDADPDATPGNLGFELEVTYESNFGVGVYSYVGLGRTELIKSTDRPEAQYAQRSIAITEDCGTPDYFYEFYIPFTDLGISSSTPLRFAAITVTSPDPSIGSSNVSDVGGIDDQTYGGDNDKMYEIIIDYQTPTSFDDLNDGVPSRTDCPGIDAISDGATSVSGTSSEADGSVIILYKDGDSIGTTTVSSGAWTVSSINPALVTGDTMTATATATDKSVSLSDCDPTEPSDCTVQTKPILSSQIDYTGGSKGYEIEMNGRPVGTIVTIYYDDYSLLDPVAMQLNSPNDVNPVTTTSTSQLVKFSCQTGGCFDNGTYHITFKSPDSCLSDYYTDCHYAADVAVAPTITTSAIETTTTSISGNGSAPGNTINIFAGSEQIATATTGASPFAYTATVSDLSLCDVITATQIADDSCTSSPSNSVTVQDTAVAPQINQDACISAAISSVSGFASEDEGDTVRLYKVINGSIYTYLEYGLITSGGTWTVSGISPSLSTETIVATVRNLDVCNLESAYSDSVNLSLGSSINTGTTYITSPITEGATTISGVGVTGETITLYIDESTVDGVSTTVVSSSAWSFTVDAEEVYIGASVTVTTTQSDKCESAQSNAVVVQCSAPAVPTFNSNDDYCYGSPGELTVTNPSSGVIYELVDENGNTLGTSGSTSGSSLVLYTDPLTSDLLNVYVTAYKILDYDKECTSTSASSNDFDFQRGASSIDLTNTLVAVTQGTTTANFPFTNEVNNPTHYSIAFSIAAKNESFSDVSSTSLPSSPIVVTVPAAAAIGNYNAVLSITGDSACGSSDNITISVYDSNDPPLVTEHPSDVTQCATGDATFSISAANVTSYQWQEDDGGGFTNITTNGTYTGYESSSLTIDPVSGLDGYLYRCVATNGNGSSTSNSAELTVESPTADAGNDATICGGSASIGGVASGGVAPYTYSWSSGPSTTNATQSVSPTATSTYTVTVTDDNLCTDIDEVTITFGGPTADAGSDATICSGSATDIGEVATGGTSPYTYLWDNNATTVTINVSPTATTTYTVTATDDNFCSDADEITLTVNNISPGSIG